TTGDDQARHTAATIRELSTRTLDELRHLVGALRTATDGADEPNLETLLDLVRDSTMDVTMRIDLEGRTLPASVAGAAYRTVQEALTNVRKHAGYAPATVMVTVSGGELVVRVDNEPPAGRKGHGTDELPSGGHGLLGLRERATLLGGDFQAGPTADGGYRVRTTFPLPPD
ncbi:MAG TPA: ATP-binding protein, partial [Pseudonocardiaceae bacterium]|nr:ATP-binding protein [Pseudonocardiaceae bacterium]